MGQETWNAVDAFVEETLIAHDEALQGALDAAAEAGLPQIQVSPPQGKLLQMLAQVMGARRVLEFGTLGGYSTILLARALPAGGRLITLESNTEYAEVARGSIERAGLAELVELRVGPVTDNVVRGGSLAESASDDPATKAQRRLHEALATEPRVTATTIQTVGGKGHDGFTVGLVR